MTLGALLWLAVLALLSICNVSAFVRPVTRVVHYHPPPARLVYTRHIHHYEPPPARLVRYVQPYPVEAVVEPLPVPVPLAPHPLPYYAWRRK